jgi:hypothetical protein
LHWGEEIEYSVYKLDLYSGTIQLSNDAYNQIHEFNALHNNREIFLQPEFGNWMVEAVPSQPYGNVNDP